LSPERGGSAADPAALWALDPTVTFLNHGSYGATPRAVLAVQQEWRDRLEAEPVRFLGRELEGHLDVARSALGTFLGADPDDLVFVSNATSGVNAVLRSLRLDPGDEILVNDHEYNAVVNAASYAAEREGAVVVRAQIPFPLADPGEVTQAILDRVTARTRIAVISHVTSPTALVFPIAQLVRELGRRGIDTLVDGAHAPGMVPLDLDEMGAAYYTGNCHKWLCGPKGSAFLHVRRDRQAQIRPLTISHGANSARSDRSRFRLEFDWTGTLDPSAYLALPAAIRFMGSLLPGGWTELMDANRGLALAGRDLLCRALAVDPPAPDEITASMAAVPLPPGRRTTDATGEASLGETLFDRYRIEVPVLDVPGTGMDEAGNVPAMRIVRISAQRYNTLAQYEDLAAALVELLSP
jgi:isopenicillin-N epimerase